MTSAHLIAEEFDRKAARYEENRLADWYIAQNREVLRHLEPEPGAVVVDIGCGTGWLLRQIARQHPQIRGLGLDLSAGMIAEARRRSQSSGLDQLHFVQADWERDGPATLESHLHGKSPNRVFCVSAFHYFQNPKEALTRIRDMLSSNGELYLVERTKTGSLMTVAWGWLHTLIIRDSVTFYSTGELHALIQAAGFRETLPLKRISRFLWHGKVYTSLILLVARGTGTNPSGVEN